MCRPQGSRSRAGTRRRCCGLHVTGSSDRAGSPGVEVCWGRIFFWRLWRALASGVPLVPRCRHESRRPGHTHCAGGAAGHRVRGAVCASDGLGVIAALVFTASHAQRSDVVLLDPLAGANTDGAARFEPQHIGGPRLWTLPDTVAQLVSQTPWSPKFVSVTHAHSLVAGVNGAPHLIDASSCGKVRPGARAVCPPTWCSDRAAR